MKHKSSNNLTFALAPDEKPPEKNNYLDQPNAAEINGIKISQMTNKTLWGLAKQNNALIPQVGRMGVKTGVCPKRS